jgi:hypothetical protein
MQEFGETDSPNPVMTFRVASTWLAVPIAQMDRVACAEQLWPVPLARPEHAGLMFDDGELVPVLRLGPHQANGELVAILHVRGESVGVAVEVAGRVHDSYRFIEGERPPDWLRAAGPRRAQGPDSDFWLIDPDRLWLAPDERNLPTD